MIRLKENLRALAGAVFAASFAVLFIPEARADAPRDIQAGQRLWLDGLDVNGTDAGNGGGTNPAATVTTWQDKSPNAFVAGEALSFTPANRSFPTYVSGVGVDFNGIRDVLEIPSGLYGDGTVVTQSDIYMIASTHSRKASFVFAQNPIFNTGNRITAHIPYSNNIIFWDHQCCGAGRLQLGWGSSQYNRFYLWNFRANSGVSQEIWREGGTIASKTTSASYTELTIDNFYVGSGEQVQAHDGVISALIAYDRMLNSAERRILLSFLDQKYAPPGGIGPESRYTNSASYRYHLGGIGQESDGNLALGTSAGLAISNSGWLSTGRYLIAGLPSLNPVSGTSTADLPSDTTFRAQRVWYLDNTSGGSGDVRLSFDLADIGVTANSGETWQLLYRSGTSGDFSVIETAPYGGGASVDFTLDNPVDGYYTIARATVIDLSVEKTSTVLSDGFNPTDPMAIPGAVVQYRIEITNNQDSPDSDTLVIFDELPSDVDLFVGDFASGAPYSLVQNAPPCAFTAPFASLSSTTDSIEFLDISGSAIVPTPDLEGYDPAVRSIRITPKGQLAAFAGGGNAPSCSINFQVRIR